MKHLLTLTFFASGLTWGQTAPKMNARELFYAPPQAPAANPGNPPAAGQGGANSGKGTAAATASTTAASTTTASTTTASTNSGKKQTTAKNTSGGGRPATGNPGSGTAGGTSATGNSSTGTQTNTGGAANPSQGNQDNVVVAQVGQQATGQASQVGQTGQAHMINASATSGPLGLRYAVLKRDASGAYSEVDPDTSFRTGDAIRLQVEANTSGYLYVVTQGTSGQWQLLFPRPQVSGGSNRVEPHVKVDVPGEKGVWKFDEHAGTEKLFVVLARQPEPDLDKLIYAIGNGTTGNAAAGAAPGGTPATGGREALLAQASIRDDVVSHLRDQMLSRDLVFEKVDEGTADSAPVKNEKAAYVVNISTAPDARVVKDFALQHR